VALSRVVGVSEVGGTTMSTRGDSVRNVKELDAWPCVWYVIVARGSRENYGTL